MDPQLILGTPDAHLEELRGDLAKTKQQIAALDQPKFEFGVLSSRTDSQDDLQRQAVLLGLKIRQQNLAQSIGAIERTAKGSVGIESVGDGFALEAIIRYKYRPALVFEKNHNLRNDEIDELGLMEDGGRSWKELIRFLNKTTGVSNRNISSIGKGVARVEHVSGAVVGTAWFFGKQHILSNRHVFVDQGWYYEEKEAQTSRWLPLDGKKGVLNFQAILGNSSTEFAKLEVEEIVPSPGVDAARALSDTEAPFILEPVLDKSELVACGDSDDVLKGRLVAVVGHPSVRDGNPGDEVEAVFGNAPLKLKRFMPGRLDTQKPLTDYIVRGTPRFSLMMHDCSTLRGASGSCLIDLGPSDLDPKKLESGEQTLPKTFGKVIGLHFQGAWSKTNYAVPTWELTQNVLRSFLQV